MHLKLGLIGYGRMGHEVERLARDRGHEIKVIFTSEHPLSRDRVDGQVDVLIDFTHPLAVRPNLILLEGTPVPIVIGTTGWLEHLESITQMVESRNMTLFHAANFSIGMNLFQYMVRRAAAMMNGFEDYDAWIHETHHSGKRDSPSGTARVLGHIMLEEMDRKEHLLQDPVRGLIPANALHVVSSRAGSVPGTHVVSFDSEADTIELTHRARNRSGFALGAIRAAEWVMGRKGVFTMKDLLGES